MGFCLFLIDSDQANVNKLDQKRRLRLEKMDRIFFELEVVPLFGDMQIAPFNYVKKMKHYDPSKWPLSSPANAQSPQVDIFTCWEIFLRHAFFPLLMFAIFL